MMAAPPSPCTRICLLDAARICIGCGRTLAEIAEWSGASPARQHSIVEAARVRLASIR
ncbi:MAG: DUF1289 domain-containing protein [Pseudomonadota bacterium]|nr:DUF1289 domain-containing protein [Pseudomonadota bacterium]